MLLNLISIMILLLILLLISTSGSLVLSFLGTVRAQEGLPAPNTNGRLSLPSSPPNANIINNTNNSNTMNLPNSPLQPLFK
jgi:hypothetical protein